MKISLLFSAIFTKLVVFSPTSLKEQFTNQTITESYANYGHVPYGKSILGKIYYDKENTFGCKQFDSFNFTDSDDMTPIILVKRGVCNFVVKSRNIQHTGGAVAIVVDDIKEDVNTILMSDDGTGVGIQIPTVIIPKIDGNKLIQFIIKEEVNATLMIQFNMENPDNIVEYDYWYSSSDVHSMSFIQDLYEYHQRFNDKELLFTPHFVSWQCVECEQTIIDVNCLHQGRFCGYQYSDPSVGGKLVLEEDLREMCVYQLHGESGFFEYAIKIHQKCYETKNEDCSRQIHDHLGFDFEKTLSCISEGSLEMLQKERSYQMSNGSQHWPAIVINNKTYRGDIEPEGVFEALCSGFKNAPSVCDIHDETLSIQEGVQVKWVWIILGIVALVGIEVVMLYCYRKYSKREIRGQMQMEVSSAVTEYMQLKK